jgi:hypothetical protein
MEKEQSNRKRKGGRRMRGKATVIVSVLVVALAARPALARIKLVAIPERADTVIRLDNPNFTLVEEERVLTLQKGLNKVDFSWKGVHIDSDSIRLVILSHPDRVTLLNVSYPPNEAALVWEISAAEAFEERVRISYLLSNIDRLVTYKGVADKKETAVDLASYVILRNFSGEDFTRAKVLLDYGEAFEQGISHEETKQLLFLKKDATPITKVWTFDAARIPWDPEKLGPGQNQEIPVTYRFANTQAGKLGEHALWGGKMRLFQHDGHGSTIFLGEGYPTIDDKPASVVPVGESMEIYIGNSRDIVVTQRKMHEKQINIRRNNSGGIVLYDTDELITAKIENFKDTPAVLTMLQHIPGQWDMATCEIDSAEAQYNKRNANTISFEITLPPRDANTGKASVRNLSMQYHRRNVR